MQNSHNPQPHSPITILKQMKCSRTRGKKGELHPAPDDPPRKRANKQRGHGTYDNDRPPIVGTVGRASGQVRLRVVHNTDRKTLEALVHRFTLRETTCYTDEWQSYNHIIREHPTVCHAEHVNGRVTMMAMVFEKCIQILLKACGQMSETTCVLLRASTKII